ncbi:hypothetical protein ACIP6P_29560 [Streptomyces sp. NPDC088729]|uniref:hypothetical protein n=1 Tax=Streptomyces sp. NPDC088729 TaxID=3365876 RepID=UPI0038003ED1
MQVTTRGGFVQRSESGTWEVRCATCHHVDELAEAHDFDPDGLALLLVPSPGAAPTLALRVLGLNRACWKCGRDTTCVVGLYPARPARGYCGLFTTENALTMALGVQLLLQNGQADLAASVKSRYSRTMRERQLANGCQHCDALQGNFPVQEEVFAQVAATGGPDGLDTLVVAECPALAWQAVVHDNSGGIIAV